MRNEHFENSVSGIYPCGEGAGYAGGITSAAMDGMKVAEAIIQRFAIFTKNSRLRTYTHFLKYGKIYHCIIMSLHTKRVWKR